MFGYSPPNDFIYEADVIPEAMGAGVLGVFVIVYVLILLFASALSMVSYVLHSLGLYTIAERRGIRHSWLAWIPLGNIWMLGSISDQYQYIAKGKIKNRRKVMLGLSIGLVVVYLIWFVSVMASILADEEYAPILLLIFGMISLFTVAIILSVLQYMAYYDLYSSCQPSNAVLYLVLSIVFSVTMPFFVFFCRKKDFGMPPRKQKVVEQITEPVQTEPEEVTEETETEEGFANPEEFEE